MRSRVKVYDASGLVASTATVTGFAAGILPTSGLSFSVEVGGGGGCQFTAIADHLDTLNARDSVIHVQLETAPATWTSVAAYALRPPFRRPKTGRSRVECTAAALLEAWAEETVILPEYTTGSIPRGAGTDRAIGWMMTAYDPSADANEAWADIYETSRVTYPTSNLETGAAWPTGTGAAWVSITGATDASERKLFRTAQASPLTITTAGPIRVHVASDSPGDFYIAGEAVLRVEGGEPGKEPILFQQADMWVEPGEYACAFDTASIWDAGGDGQDPCIVAICSLDADADPDTWLLVSNDTDWVACRRNDEPPGDEPPGPTPGALLGALVTEAADRSAAGWAGVTLGFTSGTDSYADTWPGIVVERNLRYASGDTYWSTMQMLAETLEVDCWLTPALVLEAAPEQGEDVSATVELGEVDIETMTDTEQPDAGTWMAGLGLDGWVEASAGSPRREVGYEFGSAISMPVATRMLAAALAEAGRWDASARLIPTPTHVPLVDFTVGDTIALDYTGAPATARVLSVSATAGGGGLLWDLELVKL